MANLSRDAPLRVWGEAKTEKFYCDNSSAQTIYKGEPLIINQTVDTLYAVAWHDGTGEGDDGAENGHGELLLLTALPF